MHSYCHHLGKRTSEHTNSDDKMTSYVDEIACPGVLDDGTNCGNVVLRKQKFCAECGTKVSMAWFAKELVVDSTVCSGKNDDGSACGLQLEPITKFCPNCGTPNKKLSRTSSATTTNVTQLPSGNGDTRAAPQQETSATDATPRQHVQPSELETTMYEDSLQQQSGRTDNIESPLTPDNRKHEPQIDSSASPDDKAIASPDGSSDAERSESMSSFVMVDETVYYTPPGRSSEDENSRHDRSATEARENATGLTVTQHGVGDTAGVMDTRLPEQEESQDSDKNSTNISEAINKNVESVNQPSVTGCGGDDKAVSAALALAMTDESSTESISQSSDISSEVDFKTAFTEAVATDGSSTEPISPSTTDGDNEDKEVKVAVSEPMVGTDKDVVKEIPVSEESSDASTIDLHDADSSPSPGNQFAQTAGDSMKQLEQKNVCQQVDEQDVEKSVSRENKRTASEHRQQDSSQPSDSEWIKVERKTTRQKYFEGPDPLTTTPEQRGAAGDGPGSGKGLVLDKSDSDKKNKDKASKDKKQPLAGKTLVEAPTTGPSGAEQQPNPTSTSTVYPLNRSHDSAGTDSNKKQSTGEKIFGSGNQSPVQHTGSGRSPGVTECETQKGATSTSTDDPAGTGNVPTGATAYNKKQTKPEEYKAAVDKDKKKGTGTSVTTRSATVASRRLIAVHFHVLISKSEFDFNWARGDRLLMVFCEASGLGGWTDESHVMVPERKIDEQNFLMHLVVDLEKDFVRSFNKIQYKYVLQYGDTFHKHFEFVHRKTTAYSNEIANRIFFLTPDHTQKLSDWHQYDGMMFTQPDSGLYTRFSKWTGKYSDKIIEQTKQAALAMLPSWEDLQYEQEDRRAEKLLEKVDQVCHCIKNSLVDDYVKMDRTAIAAMLLEYMETALKRIKLETSEKTTQVKSSGLKLVMACCCLHIVMQYEIKLTKDLAPVLLKALLPNPDNVKQLCPDYDELVSIHFSTDVWRKAVSGSLQNFMNRIGCGSSPELLWLLAVPLWHLLSGVTKPFARISAGLKHQTDDYWGIVDIKKPVNDFKVPYGKKIDIAMYQEVLGPLFELDKFLPRTLLSVMGFQHINRLYSSMIVPPDACLANLFYFLNTESYRHDKEFIPLFETLTNVISTWMQDVNGDVSVDKLTDTHADLLFHHKIVVEVFHLVLTKSELMYKSAVVLSALNMTAAVVSNMQRLLTICRYKDGVNKEKVDQWHSVVTGYVDDLRTMVCDWLGKALNAEMVWYSSYNRSYRRFDPNEFQIFHKLMDVTFNDDRLAMLWKKGLIDFIRNRLNRVDGHCRVYVFCNVDFTKFPREMEDCFSAAAFEVLENLANTNTGDFDFVFDAANESSSALKIRELLSRMFEKVWPAVGGKIPDENVILQHIITWPSFHRFLGLFYGKKDRAMLLSETCQDCILTSLSVLESTIQHLLTGDITVGQVQLLSTNVKNFLEVFRAVEKNTQSGMVKVPDSGVEGVDKAAVLQKVITWRKHECTGVDFMFKWVSHFADRCSDVISAPLNQIRSELDKDRTNLKISSLCKPRLYSPQAGASTDKYAPLVTCFGLSNRVRNMLVTLFDLQTSGVFHNIWNVQRRQMLKTVSPDDAQLTVDYIEQNVWQPAYKSWMALRDAMVTGDITFKGVDVQFGTFARNNDALRKELLTVCGDNKRVVDERIDQIRQYHQLDGYSRGAEAMLKLREMFELRGDFSAVEILVDLVRDRNKSLKCITKELVDSGIQLQEITDRKVECLNVLIKNKKFADWLRKSLRGPKEVKVLVDLAMISAEGQGDLEVQKVSCLHAAATGYAPLIYDLNQDMGFKDFFPLCQAVWRSLENDSQLPEKFKDTARQLEWLNRVKESHGSVELNALANARAINERGIYTVGNMPKTVQSAGTRHRKCLEGVVQLKLRLERGDMAVEDTSLSLEQIERERWQTLSLQQLNDLQSKLMLVAGKASEGKEQVDLFVEVLDGITRLGNLYVQICNAGCTLFQNWKAIFYCDPTRRFCLSVEFGKDGKHKLRGSRKDVEKGIVDHIHSLCKFMEECLKEWLYHIEHQRAKSYYLNHFTTEQLVILQTELSKVNSDERRKTLSKNIYPLLACVKHNCTLRDLEKAMYLAFRQEVEMEQRLVVSPMTDVHDDNSEDEIAAEKKEAEREDELKFLKTMEDSGYSRKLALKALKEVGADTEEGAMWCMDHEDEEDGNDVEEEMEDGGDVDKEDEMELKQDAEFDPEWRKLPATYKGLQLNTTKDSLTADLFGNVDFKGSLVERLDRLWSVYEKEMNTSVSDYLSLLHLGALLEHLAEMDALNLNRPMPSYVKKGRPNLVVCSQGEVLGVVLSLYMYGGGANIALPGTDEVLVCNGHTTAEDVELLWRRAEGDARNIRQGKIYTLVHAELLDYEVSRKVEDSLEKHSHAVDDINLVVVCCREHEDRCHMISALDRYRVKLPPIDLIELQGYLKQHFTIANVAGFTRPASSLDPEKCCVRVIRSHRAGVGKTLKVKRLHERLQEASSPTYRDPLLITIPLHCRTVDQSAVLKTLLEHTLEPQQFVPRIFHIDIAHEVQEGVDYLLFNLLILGSITDREGYVWTRSPADLYIIETMPLMQRDSTRAADKRAMLQQQQQQPELEYVHHILHLLPTVTCWSPTDSLDIMSAKTQNVKARYTNATVNATYDQRMDESEFRSAMFQRPFQYLLRFDQRQELRGIRVDAVQGTPEQCIRTLLQHCGIEDPSWAELKYFVNFLDVQLRDCENSIFCSDFLATDLPGFLNFVVQFMMQMSKDFATRSLKISEETPEVAMELFDRQAEGGQDAANVLAHYGLKRTWETSPHPYLFFNADHNSFTFMGFIINLQTGDILEPTTNRILTAQALPRPLQDALVRNRVNLSENFDQLSRIDKLTKMCNVMGIDLIYDPDPTYELTADNVKKMLAIYMRFRCHIPVIVMGETGCGKTRLIKFMCDLWKPPGAPVINMILMKVHGGTTAKDILRKVHDAVEHAKQNLDDFPGMQTVLFFDEANTTEDIGLIKEIMCDHTIRGQPLMETHGLKLIAACNPYRKHSDEMIQRLEHAGLGYHIEANQTTDKLGRIPMRHLVYRVQALPQSMLPLVWDFGQLNTDVEELYIRQMVHRYINDIDQLKAVGGLVETISKILAASQEFMRDQKDECSFVSLRDVDRTLQVMMWFYEHKTLFGLINEKAEEELEDDNPDTETENYVPPTHVTRALMLALGVCYHACLEKRDQYRQFVARYFTGPCQLENAAETLHQNISWCQDVFLDGVELGPNIARNQALKENLFMMVVCIELRIPLFLVGKPGSSKSLAKTIVADTMQGEAARTELFRTLKSVHMVSYQCSPLSTPDGIVGTFRQCAKLQETQDLNKFVSVVVLDEVGLAEDSPRMPLKTLHPLLEDGCEGDEEPAPYKKVGFIGISNWALDPAKMNRGILVQRGVPDEPELEQSAKGICSSGADVATRIDRLVRPMAKAYLELYKSTLRIREFFGLRDFYSLVKMVYGFASRSDHMPTWFELQHAILRNFGGLDDVNPVKVFAAHMKNIIDKDAEPLPTDPACDPASLIRASLAGDADIAADLDSESRYLLILTENYAALGILQQELLKIKDAIVIFGSSFPKDQEYTQVCRNINRIKVCMETGQTVVLLNLENLYESLYDALNQYYIKFGDQRFVDLGLGTQRVKCRVHLNFRLIVVAEKKVVYEKFPIPLINRLEKHFLAMDTMLSEEQRKLAKRLERWAKDFADTARHARHRATAGSGPQVGDVFIGYHADTAASVILQVCQTMSSGEQQQELDAEQVLTRGKELLLRCATPESIVRLSQSRLASTYKEIDRIYFKEQKHDNIMEFVEQVLVADKPTDSVFMQVTTHSRLLLSSDAVFIAKRLGLRQKNVTLQSLQAFDTEQQFCKMLKDVFGGSKSLGTRLLILQCDSGDIYTDLIACARYNITNEYSQSAVVEDLSAAAGDSSKMESLVHVLFIVQLPRIAGGCFVGFQGGRWLCHHIDDIHPSRDHLPSLSALKEHSVSSLFEAAVLGGDKDQQERERIEEDMETGEAADMEPMIVDDTEVVAMDTMDVEFSGVRTISGARRSEARQAVELSRKVMEGACEQQLDVEGILRNCLHPAAAMLRDKDAHRQRKTQRLQLLLSLLNQTTTTAGDLCLMDVLKQRITLLLRDKEETAMSTAVANSWLSNEAASFQRINQAGTFRRALSQYLESRVTPLLAGLLAFADTSNNLDVLGCTAQDVTLIWLRDLWLNMFLNNDITTLKYKDLQTATQRLELTEFEVKSTGPTSFTCQLPFSWIIKERVDLMIFQAKQSKEDTHSLVERLLKSSPLGSVLDKAATGGHLDDIIERYLCDYIHMVYEPQSKDANKEYELILSDLKYEAEQRLRNIPRQRGETDDNEVEIFPSTDDVAGNSFAFHKDSVLTIPAIHLTFDTIHRRVRIFSQLAQIRPECVSTLASTRVQPMPLDLKSLILLMESLTPVKDELDNANSRLEWSRKVQTLSPIVHHLLESVSSITLEQLDTLKNKCRFTWNRVCALQLFIQHVCPPGTKDQLSVKRCMPLWTSLGESTDFKTDHSLKTIENFLRLCNKQASELHFGKLQCPACSQPVEGPVKLPCSHVICLKCVVELKELNITDCPENDCSKKIPANFKAEVISTQKAAMEEHSRYKQRCNAFLMELVSRLCFTDSSPPEEAAVHRLMGYITCESKVAEKIQQLRGAAVPRTRTKKMFDEAIDPTPVVRSFLLQLLLRADIDQVRVYLQEFFDNAQLLLRADKEHIIELSLLCVQCLEDHFHATCSQMDTVHLQVDYTKQLLRESRDTFASDGGTTLGIPMLEGVAKARFGLQLCAQWIYRLYVTEEKLDRRLLSDARKLCEMAAYLCDLKQLKWPRLFLMKQIVRLFGIDILKQVSNIREVKWLVPLEARDNQNDASADHFVVLGNNYKQLRELIAKIVLGKNFDSLAEATQGMTDSENVRDRNLLLAIYREITVNTGIARRQAPATVLQQLFDFCQCNPAIKNKPFAVLLLNNTLPTHMLQVAGRLPADRALIEALIHFNIVINSLLDCKLLQPLVALATGSGNMANAFLPTMPQDELADVKEALRIGEIPVFYQCANGHPYVVGNCGRPMELANCRSCGAPIGGQQHVLVAGNTAVTVADNTRRGHILGAAPAQCEPVPERQMTAASTAILRVLTHMSMYLGATQNAGVMSAIIEPRVTDQDVPQFLWQHMLCDVDTIHTAIGRSLDDVIILIHLIVDNAVSVGPIEYPGDVYLTSKQNRQQWETTFVNQYITPVLADMNNCLQKAHNEMVNDERLGNNPLLRLLYEVDVDVTSADELIEVPTLWRYRDRVSLEHMKRKLEEHRLSGAGKGKNKKRSPYPGLDIFLREEHHLRAIRLLPNIMQLHRLLLKRFNRSIDHAEATSMTIATFLDSIREENVRTELFDLIRDFFLAWDWVRLSLVKYVFGNRTLPTEYAQMPLNEQSCLAVLLPSLRGYGLCSVALTYFLVEKQNDFLGTYSQKTEQKLSTAGIDISDAGNAHLISFQRERDLLPIILANCNYSLELGKGTKIEYDFASMEKQIEERFIRGRPMLKYQIDFVLFREDFTNAAVFTELRSRIPQEPLANPSSIEKELRQKLTEVNDLLASLDITVGFLVSVAGDPNAGLVKFMTDTLQMKHRQQLMNVIQTCRLKHVESLWLLLSYMRACMQANYGQDPFDTVEDKYREKIPDELVSKVKLGLQHVNMETFLPGLHECILFRMAVKQDTNHEDYVDNVDQPLNYVLHEYLEEKGISVPALTDGRFPADVKVKHCVAIWRLAQKPARRLR